MAWIRTDADTPDHPKVRRLARKLQVCQAQAFGHVSALWCWTAKYALEKGDLSRFDVEDIADAAKWDGDPEQFAEALRASRLLDEDQAVHGWTEHQGHYIGLVEQQRRATRAAAEKRRSKQDDQEPPAKPTRKDDEVATSLDDQGASSQVVSGATGGEVSGSSRGGVPGSSRDEVPGSSSDTVSGSTRKGGHRSSHVTILRSGSGSGSGEEKDPPTPQRGEPPAEPDGGTPPSPSRKRTQAIHPQAEELVAEYEQLSGWPRGDATLRFACAALERYGPDRIRSAIVAYRAELEAEPRDRKHVLRTHNWFGRDAAWKRYEGLQPAAQPEPEGPAYDRRKVLLAVRSMAESRRTTWQSEAKLVMVNAGVGSLRERRELLAEAEERTRAGTWGELAEEGGE